MINPRPTVFFSLFLIGFFFSAAVAGDQPKTGVYEYVVREATVDFEAASASLDNEIKESSYELLARLDAASPEECAYRARVFVLNEPDYAAKLLAGGAPTAPFAIPLRINLFEDEQGLHAAIVNPVGVNRTILLDDAKYEAISESARVMLRALVAEAVPGKASSKPFGPLRKKGYIGKTMGVMAGGPFDEKIEIVAEQAGVDLAGVVKRMQAGIDNGTGKWGMGVAYALTFDEQGVAVMGMTGPALESKSFAIVEEGGDSSRKKMECAGIAHAAAYPIDVVVATTGDGLEVRRVQSMYRMKMFFEDAGKWAFMKNMGMPGSIGDEMKEKVEGSLE